MRIAAVAVSVAAAPVLAAQFDYIRLTPPSSAALIVEGRRASGCTAQIHTGRSSVSLRNLLTSEACPARVAVFAAGYGAQLMSAAQTWSDASGDVLRIKLGPRAIIPVHTWALYDPCSERDCTASQLQGSKSRAQADVQRASDLYGQLRSGIGFKHVGVHDMTSEPAARTAWDLGCTPEGEAARGALGHVPDALNVYYVRETGPRGLWCEPDTILINWNAYDSTLAHEIGHALALDHTENVRGIHEDNLMNASGAMRYLTLGQLFRANFARQSIVNRFGLRSGAVLECAPESADPGPCPALTLDTRRPVR